MTRSLPLILTLDQHGVPHRWVTWQQAVRYLTDHVCGDIYYRIDHPGQNLERARNQLALLTAMVRR